MFKKSFFLLVVIHFSLLFIMASILNLLRDECVAINNSSIASYDAGWYKDIAVNGYSIKESNQSNVAFFPLFPMLWRLSNTSNIGISLINLSIFLFSIFLIWRSYQLKVIELLLCLSIPSLFFCWVPFSEALFL